MQDQTDPVGAFLPGPRAAIAGAPEGPLAGLTFAVKDLYDVAGHVTGYGSPDWARTHPVAPATAPCIMDLIAAGASLLGKVKTMELAYGLSGENIWYGTPINPAAPDRFPGGSSCGSAAATAAGLVDFAMGTDTGGSVRVPASYCGIFGIRPSWGRSTWPAPAAWVRASTRAVGSPVRPRSWPRSAGSSCHLNPAVRSAPCCACRKHGPMPCPGSRRLCCRVWLRRNGC